MFDEHILEFTQTDVTIVVLVKGLERFVDGEERSLVESESDIFRGIFVSEDAVKDWFQSLLGGVWESLLDGGREKFI